MSRPATVASLWTHVRRVRRQLVDLEINRSVRRASDRIEADTMRAWLDALEEMTGRYDRRPLVERQPARARA